MARLLVPLAFAVVTSLSAQIDASRLTQMLSFEGNQKAGELPAGWHGAPPGTIFADDKIFHGGRWSARIERGPKDSNGFSSFNTRIPIDFAGKTVELHGFIRIENVSGSAGLWMREDGDSPNLAFDNMHDRQVKGTADWTEYSIVLPVHPGAKELYFGFLLSGTGKAWVDDLRLLVDGKPVWEAPKVERPKTVLDADTEFDHGSRVDIDALSPVQIGNLATLGKVWGFLKYHHPAITSGKRHWDYDLFRILPSILKAPDRASANAALLQWVTDLGPASCTACATSGNRPIHLRPHVDWLSTDSRLGETFGDELASAMRGVYNHRSAGKQFYISQAPGVGNPVFDHELAYAKIPLPDAGFQLLALYRFWNIVEYWFPYRDVLGEDWDKVLTESIPRVAMAGTSEEYQRQLMALIARAHDTHSNLWSSLKVRPPAGDCGLPIVARFVENQPVVTAFTADQGANDRAFHVGDILLALDGKAVTSLVSGWTPFYADSNDAARQRDIAQFITRGACGEATVRLRRQSETLQIETRRVAPVPTSAGMTHDLPGDTFRLLSPEAAYLKLSSVKAGEARRYVESAAGTKGFVIDIRNYPSEFVVFALGSLLVDKETPFARFTTCDLSNPGAFQWGEPLSLKPESPHYAGKVVILVDETSQSSAEYTAMAFRASPNATVVGSTTAGADGNISRFSLPGGLSSMISGIGVFYPNKQPTQRVGIVPDVVVRPTIQGIREGRDEVLEVALRQILGPDVPAARIREMSKP